MSEDVASYLEKRKQDGTLLIPKEEEDVTPSAVTLSQAVDLLACRCIALEGIAGEMWATIKINAERGYLVAKDDDGKLRLDEIVALWRNQLDQR